MLVLISTASGTYTILVNAYDAGTEVNNELLIGAAGGKRDLDNTVHRWLNPVLKVTVIVK